MIQEITVPFLRDDSATFKLVLLSSNLNGRPVKLCLAFDGQALVLLYGPERWTLALDTLTLEWLRAIGLSPRDPRAQHVVDAARAYQRSQPWSHPKLDAAIDQFAAAHGVSLAICTPTSHRFETSTATTCVCGDAMRVTVVRTVDEPLDPPADAS